MVLDSVEDFTRKWLVTAIILFLVFAFDGLGVFRPVRFVLEPVVVSLQGLGYWSVKTASYPYRLLKFSRNGLTRVSDLEARLAERAYDSAQLAALEQENHELRKLLGAPLPPSWQFLPARILSVSSDKLMLSAGENQGVKVGMSVVAQNVLLGIVEEVTAYRSLVALTSSAESKLAVVLEKSQVTGIVSGKANQLVVSQILQTQEVKPGSLVLTAGSDQAMPGLLVGRVAERLSQDSDIHQSFRLEPMIESANLYTAFIITSWE